MERFEQLIMLIDFDKTICDSDYPKLGPAFPYAKDVINKWYEQGLYIIINTCRTGKAELEAEVWLLKNGFKFHKMNDHHPNGLLHYGTQNQIDHNLTSRKVWGHIIIDDLNLDWAVNGMPGWDDIDKLTQEYVEKADVKYKTTPNYDFSYLAGFNKK